MAVICKKFTKCLTAFIVVGVLAGGFALTSVATTPAGAATTAHAVKAHANGIPTNCFLTTSGALRPFIPGGVARHNSRTATIQVMSYLAVSQCAQAVVDYYAHDTSYVPSHWQDAGYYTGAPGTTNSGMSSGGAVVRTADTKECNGSSEMLVLNNIETGVKISFCVACTNIRVPGAQTAPPHKFVNQTVLRFTKTVSKNITVCGSTALVTVTVKGTVRMKTWYAALQRVNLKSTNALTEQVNVAVKATQCAATGPGQVNACPAGFSMLNGSCVNQSNTASASSSESCGNGTSAQAGCTTTIIQIQVNNNCGNVYLGSGNASGDTCNTPPSTTTTTTPPAPTMTVKNVTSPQEADNDGEGYPNLYADVYSSNGDSVTCTISVVNPNDQTKSGYGSISGQRSFTFTSSGYNRVGPYTYQAPNDGTGSDVGHYDQLGVTCHDNSNSAVKDVTGYSNPFEIQAPPATH